MDISYTVLLHNSYTSLKFAFFFRSSLERHLVCRVAGDNCSDAEVFLNDVLSCVELALSTIFGSSTVSDCINVFAAKGRGTVEMNRTVSIKEMAQ